MIKDSSDVKRFYGDVADLPSRGIPGTTFEAQTGEVWIYNNAGIPVAQGTVGGSSYTKAEIDAMGILDVVAVPAAAGSAGTVGQIAFSATHFYRCTALNTWVRVAMATWV